MREKTLKEFCNEKMREFSGNREDWGAKAEEDYEALDELRQKFPDFLITDDGKITLEMVKKLVASLVS